MGNSFTTTAASGAGGESGLVLTRSVATRALYRYAGLSATGTKTSEQLADVDAWIKSGENGFYKCQRLPGERSSHVWSFLKPMLTQALVADTKDYTLPADFGGFIGPKLYYSPTDSQCEGVALTKVGEILKLRERGTTSVLGSMPKFAAVCPLANDGTSGQRQQLMVYPTPSSNATLYGRYWSAPHAISDDTPYPLGGQPHSDSLLESMLAAAELRINDERGPHAARFLELLIASVDFDRSLTTPRSFGYNGNHSGNLYDRGPRATGLTYTPVP
jgi:hypothetical protein